MALVTPGGYGAGMSFDVTADAYAAFMGRYAEPLADRFLDLLDPQPGERALDVGAGTGALATRLAQRLGPGAVAAVEPMPAFVEYLRQRVPALDVRQGHAQNLPFGDGELDLVTAQLVVNFIPDPVAGLQEMRRVARTGGRVAASVWDHDGGRGPLSPFWAAAHQVRPDVVDEATAVGSRRGHLAELFAGAGLEVVDDTELTVTVHHPDFEEWWEPYTFGVGPVGEFVRGLPETDRDEIRRICRGRLGDGFDLTATAWVVVGRA